MSVRGGQSLAIEFTTRNFSTGAAANADSLPTGVLVVNGVDNGAAVTVANVATGRYKAAVTLPALSIGDIVELVVSAAVGGVTDSAIVYRDTCDLSLASSGKVAATVAAGDDADAASLRATVGAAGAGLTALGDTRLAHLDADVSSRSTYAGGAVAGVTGDVAGKVLGGGSGTITGAGAWALDGSGSALASHADASALSSQIGTPQQAGSAVTLPSNPPTDFIVAASIGSGALNGKGDWLPANSYTAPDNTSIALAAANTTTLLARVSSTLFGGITSLGNWLRAALRSSTPDATALAEINTGGGAYDATANSLQAVTADAGDPMGNAPSHYVSGTLGNLIGNLSTTPIQVSSPVLVNGNIGPVVRGDDYSVALGNALTLNDAGQWPDNPTAIVLELRRSAHRNYPDPDVTVTTVSMSPASGAGKVVTIQLARAVTAALAPDSYRLSLVFTCSDGTSQRTPNQGILNVLSR